MLLLPTTILHNTIRQLSECGAGEAECMMFWFGPADDSESVVGVVHPAHHRSPFGCDVDSNWLNSLWFELAEKRLSLRAQIHTHPGLAFHSATDDQFPIVSQPGFLSIVVPDFATGPIDFDTYWFGTLQKDGLWVKVDPQTAVRITQ